MQVETTDRSRAGYHPSQLSGVALHGATSSSLGLFALFETLVDRAPVGLAIWDRDLRCVAVNTASAARTPGRSWGGLGATLGAGGRQIEGLLRGVFVGRYPTVDIHVPSAASLRRNRCRFV